SASRPISSRGFSMKTEAATSWWLRLGGGRAVASRLRRSPGCAADSRISPPRLRRGPSREERWHQKKRVVQAEAGRDAALVVPHDTKPEVRRQRVAVARGEMWHSQE